MPSVAGGGTLVVPHISEGLAVTPECQGVRGWHGVCRPTRRNLLIRNRLRRCVVQRGPPPRASAEPQVLALTLVPPTVPKLDDLSRGRAGSSLTYKGRLVRLLMVSFDGNPWSGAAVSIRGRLGRAVLRD